MKHLLLLLTFSLVVAACSVSGEINIGTPTVENATEDFIEETFWEQIGLGELNASCSKPADEEVGTRFLCTALTETGDTIEMQAVVEEGGSFVETTNLVLAENLPNIVATVVSRVEELAGVDLPDDALDCGTTSIVVNVANEITCEITDLTGETFDTTITFNGLDTDDPTFDFVVDTDS